MWTENEYVLITSAVGGEKNIVSISSCFTRVRIQVVDLHRIHSDVLKTLPLVKGILVRGEEVQLVVGLEATLLAESFNKYFKEAQKVPYRTCI